MSSVSATHPRARLLDINPATVARTAAASLVVITAALTWLLSDVGAGEAIKFVAYEAVYCVLPGCLLYLLLTSRPGGWLRTLAIGWPCGYALELGWFAATAALHARWAYALLPAVAVLVTGPLVYVRARRRRASPAHVLRMRAAAPAWAGWDTLAVAAAISAALVLLAFTFFAPSPLPGHARSVVYGVDSVFDISLAAEARHHWPITEPWVAGQSLRYYTGSFIHMAAINQVTGIPLATVVLRLFPSVMLLLVSLQLWWLGSAIGRSRWVGPLAVALLVVVADVNLDPVHSELLIISPFSQFSLSPSFAFGVPFLLAMLALVQSWLPAASSACAWATTRSRGAKGSLAMIALLAVACGAAKAFSVAVAIGGLALFWLWCAVTRRPARLVAYGTVLACAGGMLVYVLMLSGGKAATLTVHPLDFLTHASTFEQARTALRSVVGGSFLWVLVLVALAPLVGAVVFAPLLGTLWLWRSRDALPPFVVLCICMFAVGLLAYVTLDATGGVEGVFLVYGYIALLPAAAVGLVRLWSDTPSRLRGGIARGCAALLVLALALALAGSALGQGHAREAWYALSYTLIAAVIAAVVARRARLYAPTSSSAVGRVVACCVPLLVVLGLVKPATLAAVGAAKAALHRQVAAVNSSTSYGMTAALYDGLLWVRAHTSSCDVLAVNNHLVGPPPSSSTYFYYSAFTERRVFLESWYYTPDSVNVAQPFPARFALNTEATARGSASALRRLAADGVSYVLIDKLHGGGAPEPAGVSRLVFENSALVVYRLGGARTRAACS